MQATIWTILCTTYGAWLGKSEISEIIQEDGSESCVFNASLVHKENR